jgi:lycopene cyclase domain-containing protein
MKQCGMRHWGYMAMLIFTVLGSFWLEIFLKVGVLRRVRRMVLSIAPVALIFIGWDAYAISRHHWHFDPSQILQVYGPFHIPLEEYLFFLVVPIAAIMTLEAVRRRRPDWLIGDEQ